MQELQSISIFFAGSSDVLRLSAAGELIAYGNVGIGTQSPAYKLDIAGTANFSNAIINGQQIFHTGNFNPALKANDAVVVHKTGNEALSGQKIFNDFIGIGAPYDPAYKLIVNGTVKARSVKVDPNNWPDYVFEKNYNLPPISETAQYIKDNKHLPGIPSAKEVSQTGINLGEMNALLLKKIEELTLYLIKQQERLDEQNGLLQKQQLDINRLKSLYNY